MTEDFINGETTMRLDNPRRGTVTTPLPLPEQSWGSVRAYVQSSFEVSYGTAPHHKLSFQTVTLSTIDFDFTLRSMGLVQPQVIANLQGRAANLLRPGAPFG